MFGHFPFEVRITPWESAVPCSGSTEPVQVGPPWGSMKLAQPASIPWHLAVPVSSARPDHPHGICDLVMLSEALL